MSIYYQDGTVTLHHGDCLDVLATLPDASVDAVVTDPPYGLANTDPAHVADTITRWVNGERDYLPGGSGFMGKEWDAFVPPAAVWDECLRVLKPGGHVLTFAGSRTVDLMTLGLRLAGFEIRDSIAWLYGSGFPKSLDVSKAIDKHLTPRDLPDLTLEYRFTEWARSTGVTSRQIDEATGSCMGGHYLTAKSQPAIPTRLMLEQMRHLFADVPQWVEEVVDQREREKAEAAERQAASTFLDTLALNSVRNDIEREDALRWQGWGTALKPAFEPVVVARKPLTGTVAANVLEHGTGALNVDATRIATDEDRSRPPRTPNAILGNGNGTNLTASESNPAGRWPTNVVLDDTHEPVLRLRYNLPTEVERTIRESFGASTDHLPAVRDTRDGAAEQGQAPEVLHPQVPGAMDVGEPDGRARPEVGQAAHAGNSGADLGDQEGQPPHGREGRELEGRALPQSRVRLREVVDAPAERAGDLRADGDPQRRDLHTGAPASRGAATRAGADLRGDRASRERTQGGQPAGEPGTPRVEQLAPDEARRGRRRDVPAATGERTTPGRPLEVLRRECPPGWWHYFEVVGHRREGQAAALDEQSGETSSRAATSSKPMQRQDNEVYGKGLGTIDPSNTHTDQGGASRFFPTFRYEAKAPTSERPKVNGVAHPTVKPLDLLRWMVRLVTPPGGTVLEPFAGSGTTVEACVVEGFKCVAIEKTDEYLPLTVARIHRRRDPVAAIKLAGDDLGLFDLGEDTA